MTHDAPATAQVDPPDDKSPEDKAPEDKTPEDKAPDLARQLDDAKVALVAARRELETLRVEHEELRLRHEQMRASKAFRIAECVWSLRTAVFPKAGRRR